MRTARRNRNVPADCGSSPSIAERAYDSVSRNADMANSTSTTSNRVSSENTGLVVPARAYWQTWKATIARAAMPR
jgi:hypothetical protein